MQSHSEKLAEEEVSASPTATPDDGLIESSNKQTDYAYWQTGGGTYMPTRRRIITKGIKPGLYKVSYDGDRREEVLIEQKLATDDIIELPMKETDEIMCDISTFWDRYNKYKEYGLTHKRGILMHGDPGNGKSYIIRRLVNDIIRRNGIVITVTSAQEMRLYYDLLPKLKKISPEMPLITIMEDIDDRVEEDESVLLNILDGLSQVDKIVYVATTNYVDKLAARILNRPSRFDRRYRIDPPNAEVRKSYLTQKLKEGDLQTVDIDQWVADTDGMSIAHLRELIASVIIMGNDYKTTVGTLKDMKNLPSRNSESTIGFALEGRPLRRSR